MGNTAKDVELLKLKEKEKKSTMTTKIRYLGHGIASRQGDNIFLHKNLKDYPKLHNRILLHESDHTSGFTWNDFIMDLNNSHLKDVKKDYYSFILKNPSSWTEFLPFWSYDGQLIINPTLLLFYGLVLSLGGFITWLLR